MARIKLLFVSLLSALCVGCGSVSYGVRTSLTHDAPDQRQINIRREVQRAGVDLPPQTIVAGGVVFTQCAPGSCHTKRYTSCEASGVRGQLYDVGTDTRYNVRTTYSSERTVYWSIPDGIGSSRGFPGPRTTWADYGPQYVVPSKIHSDLKCQSDGTLTTRSRF